MTHLHFPERSAVGDRGWRFIARGCRAPSIVALSTALLFGSGLVFTPPMAAAGSTVDQVLIVFKTHFDIGYTDMASNVVQRYRTTMMDQALQVCDQNRDLPPAQQFVWTIPGWPMKKILDDWPGQTPERKQKILAAFKSGRFVVHALPFTTHTELLELEDLTRGLGFATRLSQAAGLALPRDAKMTDVPCHSWIMPTLLRRAGVDFLHLGCNAASQSPAVPVLFWWEGPDGSRLLTMYTAESYGTGLIPPKGWPYKTWLALIHTGDNHGPPNPDEVKKLLQEAREKLPAVKVRIGRLSDFADAILAEKADLPIVRGDMLDTWIHGPMSDPIGAKIARNVRPAITMAELLDTQLRAWGIEAPAAAPTIATAWENSLLYGEHTWGGALYWVTSYSQDRKFNYGGTWKAERAQGRFTRLEASWAEHTAYIETAQKLVTPLMDQQMHVLGQSVNVDGPRIVVYNPLPWKRSGPVTLPAVGTKVEALQAVNNRTVLPASTEGDELRFVAVDVPAMGCQTYVPVSSPAQPAILAADARNGVLENQFLKVALDPARGVVRSLIDKQTGRELVDSASPYGLGQLLYERFDADQVARYVKAYVKINAEWATNELGKPAMPPAAQVPYRAASPSSFVWRLEQSAAAVAVTMAKGANPNLPFKVATKVTLYRGQPFVDLELTILDKPADPWPEAGWICLPLKVSAPQFHLGRLGSIIDPTRDIVPGANHFIYAINSGVAVVDSQGAGVGICPIDHPLISLDVPGCWRYAARFTPQKPTVFVNLFNNQWTTNFRLWNQGTWSSRVRLWALSHYTPESGLISPALEARYPLQAVMAQGAPGHLPPMQTGLEISRQGVLVTAFAPDPEGKGTLLRLWEQAGAASPCRVRLPAGMKIKTVQPIDLRGQPQGKSLAVRNGAFSYDLEAFAPASFLLLN